MNTVAVALVFCELVQCLWRLPHEIKWFHESCCHLNSNTRPFERMEPQRSTSATGASDRTTAGLDEGLLWPLPHLSPFTLQPVGKKTEALENLIPLHLSKSTTDRTPPPLHVQVSISKGTSELIADINLKKTEQRAIKLHWRQPSYTTGR